MVHIPGDIQPPSELEHSADGSNDAQYYELEDHPNTQHNTESKRFSNSDTTDGSDVGKNTDSKEDGPKKGKPARKLNALEQAKVSDDGGPKWLRRAMVAVLSSIPLVNDLLGLKVDALNLDDRQLYFNSALPDELLERGGLPKAKYSGNKVRTAKYTPISFLPKNIILQFQNIANIYFLAVAIFSGFDIFGVNNAGLAAVPIIAIVVVTAIRDGFEDWRRQYLDRELNDTLTVVLKNIENHNSPVSSISWWRRFKKSISHPLIKMENKITGRKITTIDSASLNDNQSYTSATINEVEKDQEVGDGGKPVFKPEYWKNIRVGDVIKVYADTSVPADIVILSSSDPEGDCFIDTRNLDGESNLKPRKSLNSTKHIRRPWHLQEMRFKFDIEGANSDLDSFGYNYTDLDTGNSEAIVTANFLPRGSTVRNSRWVIGYVVYTGSESKIVLNSGETPTKRSRLARELNFYVICNFTFLFTLCFISGVIEGIMFQRKRNNIAYYFEEGLLTKNPALNGFVTFFAAMLVLQNMVPISLYIVIEIGRTFWTLFMYSDTFMYDEETDYPCTPKSWAIGDDLGQIEYIFSDKTGTLTQNSMVFRKCSINGKAYGNAFTEAMAGQLKRENADVPSVRKEREREIEFEKIRMNQQLDESYKNPYIYHFPDFVSEPIVADMSGYMGPKQSERIEQFALALSLCNTVVVDSRSMSREDTSNQLMREQMISPASDECDTHRKSANIFDQEDHEYRAEDLQHLPLANTDDYDTTNNQLRKEVTRNTVHSVASRDRGASLELKKVRTGQVYGGGNARTSVGSARPRQSLDYRNMDGKVLVYKAESPDESALVTMARDIGYTLVADDKHSKTVDMRGAYHKFHVYQTILFSSQRKRMSVIIRDEVGRCYLLMKGADSVVEKHLSSKTRETPLFVDTLKQLENFGNEGLRTLMIAYKELDPHFTADWSKRFDAAAGHPDRETIMEELAGEIECDLELLGATGIEDELQLEVPETIETLSKAGIKLWMLTGDKVETAISIGFSCNLLEPNFELLIVKRPEELGQRLSEMGLEVNEKTLKEAGDDHSPASGNLALIIDGTVLSELTSNQDLKLQFALLGKKCRSVLCCRVSPSQKAAVVHIMKSTFDVMCIAVGDGANDVSMIQVADVGIGIVGVEGRQAAMSSDIAIGQFKFLQRLLLCHGRWCYNRAASMIECLLFQNFVFSMTLFWYNIFAQYDQSYLYDYTYLTLFNSVFVSFPIAARGILDQDLPSHILLKYPELYGNGILRQAWTKKKYFIMATDAIYQSAVCFFFVYSIFFNGTFYSYNGIDLAFRQGMGVLACTTAVFTCNLYVLLNQYRWDFCSLGLNLFSDGFFFLWTCVYSEFVTSNFFYKTGTTVIGTAVYWAYFCLSLCTTTMPRFVYTAVQRIWYPTDVDIIREISSEERQATRPSFWFIPSSAYTDKEEALILQGKSPDDPEKPLFSDFNDIHSENDIEGANWRRSPFEDTQ